MAHEHIEIKTPDGTCDTYVSYPDTGGPFPAILFYMDGIGIRDVLYKMADRIASFDYVVLLPHMFYRAGHAPVAGHYHRLRRADDGRADRVHDGDDRPEPLVHTDAPGRGALGPAGGDGRRVRGNGHALRGGCGSAHVASREPAPDVPRLGDLR